MTQQDWEQATPEQRAAEIDRCLSEPWYFYNTYYRPEGGRELTEEDWKGIYGFIEIRKRKIRRFNPFIYAADKNRA